MSDDGSLLSTFTDCVQCSSPTSVETFKMPEKRMLSANINRHVRKSRNYPQIIESGFFLSCSSQLLHSLLIKMLSTAQRKGWTPKQRETSQLSTSFQLHRALHSFQPSRGFHTPFEHSLSCSSICIKTFPFWKPQSWEIETPSGHYREDFMINSTHP